MASGIGNTALDNAGPIITLASPSSTRSSARCWYSAPGGAGSCASRARSAPRSPGFDVLAAALSLHLELEVVETGSFAVVTDLEVARDRSNLAARVFDRLHPADGFEFRISSKIPLSGGLGSSAAAILAGLLAADHPSELDADVRALATVARGSSRQHRRLARGRIRDLPGRARAPARSADGA